MKNPWSKFPTFFTGMRMPLLHDCVIVVVVVVVIIVVIIVIDIVVVILRNQLLKFANYF